jgi:hypothetical protein
VSAIATQMVGALRERLHPDACPVCRVILKEHRTVDTMLARGNAEGQQVQDRLDRLAARTRDHLADASMRHRHG